MKGRIGNGQLSTTSFSVPANAIGFWIDRLKEHNVEFKGPQPRFDEEALAFRDTDGLQIELVASGIDTHPAWKGGPVPAQYAIRGFYHVSLSVESYERTAGLLTETLEFRPSVESGSRFRYVAADGKPGQIVDIVCRPEERPGMVGVGAVHHVAWRTPTEETQLEMRNTLESLGYQVTPVLDRNYFKSIYFREPGKVLFEIATDPPGFAVNEEPEKLGKGLQLPAWLESRRDEIEQVLPQIASSA